MRISLILLADLSIQHDLQGISWTEQLSARLEGTSCHACELVSRQVSHSYARQPVHPPNKQHDPESDPP